MNKSNFKYGLIAVTALVTASVSCDKQPDKQPEPEPLPASITITDEIIEVPAGGGIQNISFSIENPVSGEEIAFSCDCDWISELTATADNHITFNVATNNSTEIRETTISVSYAESQDSFIVKQLGNEKEKFDIQIVIDPASITDSKALVDFIPSDLEQTYLTNIITKEQFEQYKDNDECISYDIEYWKSIAEIRGTTFIDMLKELLLSGKVEDKELTKLYPETAYVVYAYAIDNNGTVRSGLFTANLTTNKVQEADITFNISYEINGTNVKMKIEPSDEEQRYYFGAFSNEELESSGDPIETIIQNIIDARITSLLMLGLDQEQALISLLYSGVVNGELNLTEQTNYTGYAVAVNDEGRICSDVTTKEFKTGSAQ